MENVFLKKEYKSSEILLKKLVSKQSSYWEKRGDKMALSLFHAMSKRVPAYKKFLKKNKINPRLIKNINDFKKIPTLDKDSYLRAYPLNELCWDGKLDQHSWVIASTSGSTGEPFYLPRETEQDLQYALTAELYLRTNFQIHQKTTLYIDAFPMGPWIGGLFTYQAIKHIADNGKYPLSIITTSIDKHEIIKAVKKFGHLFDQIIIGSYGPFLKDTLDEGFSQGLNWKNYNLNFIFSAEGFSETFRDYILEIIGKKCDMLATLNHYGTVDLGTMAYETPPTIALRRRLIENKIFTDSFFGRTDKLPTLCQFIPEHFYFEQTEKEGLLCSSYSGIPLVRYDLKDSGKVISYTEGVKRIKSMGLSFSKIMVENKIPKNAKWQLPFVFVFERSDFSVSFYAFQIYPETIRKALQTPSLIRRATGKFTMMVDYDTEHNQQLFIHVELCMNENKNDVLLNEIQQSIKKSLLTENSEYKKTFTEKGTRILPQIILHKYEDMEFFKPGIKQKWTKK